MSWLRRRHGRHTEDLRRQPGGFGLAQVPARLAPDEVVRTVCGFCSVGCGLDVHRRDGRPVNLTPAIDHPVNRGHACPKGWEALSPLMAPGRATTPLVRDRTGRLRPTSWDRALDTMVHRFRAVQADHGPDALAFLSTGQITTEEMALLGAVAKFGMGMVHGDGNTRQCMATAVAAYKAAFGFDAPPYSYDDLERSDVLVFWGANPCIAHPVLWQRVCANPHRPAVIVADPRRTETAAAATHHLALAPKSDLVVLYGLARALIERGAVDHRFVAASTVGFEAFRDHVQDFTPERVAAESGLDPALLDDVVELIAGGRRVSFWWTMGVNQSHEGVLSAQALIGLALLTGNIGRPGTGANSITGQCNAMGSRLFSNTTNLYGGRDFADAADRREVAEVLDIDVGRIPDRPSMAYDQIVEGIATGAIRGLWVVATNSAHSWINHGDLHDLLGRLDVLVVQDLFATTETARRADIVLPAAGWGEKAGTFINSERRVGLVQPVAPPPGQARTDFDIFHAVARAWGCDDLVRPWRDPEAVFQLLQRLSAGRPCDLTGIDGYDHLRRAGGVPWPHPALGGGADGVPGPTTSGDTTGGEGTARLFEDGRFFHPDGRARFCFGSPRPPRERPSERYPFVLLTGRGSAAQWHTETRTATSAILRRLAPERRHVEISPVDARRLSVVTGDPVELRSGRGAMVAHALVTSSVQPGHVFVAMHDPAVNRLTHPSFDPTSRQPSYKYAAVDVRRVPGPTGRASNHEQS